MPRIRQSTPDLRPVLRKKPLPEWICKCVWHSTACKIVVNAKNESEAWDVAWRKVARTEGGSSCLQITVIGRKNA